MSDFIPGDADANDDANDGLEDGIFKPKAGQFPRRSKTEKQTELGYSSGLGGGHRNGCCSKLKRLEATAERHENWLKSLAAKVGKLEPLPINIPYMRVIPPGFDITPEDVEKIYDGSAVTSTFVEDDPDYYTGEHFWAWFHDTEVAWATAAEFAGVSTKKISKWLHKKRNKRPLPKSLVKLIQTPDSEIHSSVRKSKGSGQTNKSRKRAVSELIKRLTEIYNSWPKNGESDSDQQMDVSDACQAWERDTH